MSREPVQVTQLLKEASSTASEVSLYGFGFDRSTTPVCTFALVSLGLMGRESVQDQDMDPHTMLPGPNFYVNLDRGNQCGFGAIQICVTST